MNNMPSVKIGIVVGSTDWLPSELAESKRRELISSIGLHHENVVIHECPICLTDNEINIKRVKKDLLKAECDALCLVWANYGPESAGTLLAEEFEGPVMMCALAEERQDMFDINRMDSMSGFSNACYALNLRKTKVYIPRHPVGTIDECSEMIYIFSIIVRTLVALKELKVMAFGPRPTSYLASLSPVNLLYELGIEISEYSELELYESFIKHSEDPRIEKVIHDMENEISNIPANVELSKLAQYEVTLTDWIRVHKGSRKYSTLASTCWPAFPVNFGFVPCYVNSRLTGNGFPVSCEADVYGAVCEYIGQTISDDIVTILNINNNIPIDFYDENIKDREFNGKKYNSTDIILGYHCGVTSSKKLKSYALKPHFVNNRLIGEEKSQGTIQGVIQPGYITAFRIQGTSDGRIIAYVVQGQILPLEIDTYGGYGIIAISEMERFFRNIVLEKHFPNHMTVMFGLYADILVDTLRYLGINEIYYNNPKNVMYESEMIYNEN